MSSFLTHLLIPVLIVLSLGIFRIRDAWVWSWATWASDLDYLGWVAHVQYGVTNVHRALLHNVLLLALLVGFSGYAWTRWQRAGGATLAAFAHERAGWLLVPFFYATHLALDVFAGGVSAFWPLSTRTYFWDFEIDVDTTKPVPQPIVVSQPGSVEVVPAVSEVYLWMTAEQFGIFLLYATALGLTFLYEWANGRPLGSFLRRVPADPSPPAPTRLYSGVTRRRGARGPLARALRRSNPGPRGSRVGARRR